MRVDKVGVGDVGEVHGGARGSGPSSRQAVMTAEEGAGSSSRAWSAEVASMSMVRRGNRGGTGSASVTVHGGSLGLVEYTARALEGHTGCEATE